MRSRLDTLFTKLFLLLLLFLVAGGCLYALFGEQIIRQLYDGRLPFTSHTLFESDPTRPVEYYIDRADKITWEYVAVGIPLTILIWWIVAKAVRHAASPKTNYRITSDIIPEHRFRFDSLMAFLSYSAFTVAISWPVIQSFSTSLPGPPEDNFLFFWNFWWMTEKVIGDGGSLIHTSYLFYPEGAHLFFHSWSFFNLALSVVLNQVMNLYATYNLIALHTYPVAGLGAFVLVRYLTRNSYIALLGGFLFAFCPYHHARLLHHINLMSIQFIPFFVLFYIKAIRQGGKSNTLLAAVFLLLNALCTWTYLIFGLLFIFLSYLYLALRRRQFLMPDVVLKSSVVAGSVLVALSPWLWKMVQLDITGSVGYKEGRKGFVTDLLGLVVPGEYHWLSNLDFIDSLNSTFTGNAWEATTYLGIPALALVVIASLRILPIISRYLTAALAFLLMSLGYDLHILGNKIEMLLPDVITNSLPILSSISSPSRYIIYVYLFWSILVAVAAGYLIYSAGNRAARIGLALLLPVLLIADYFKSVDVISGPALPSCYEKIAHDHGRLAVLDLPTDVNASRFYMYYQTHHGRPIVQGYIARKIDKTLIDRLELHDLERQKSQLEMSGVGYIMIHKRIEGEHDIVVDRYRAAYSVICEDSTHLLLEVP